MPLFDKDKLSSSQHKRIFETEILPDKLKGLKPALRPKMFMLGGQPGAGKTNVRKAITDQEQFAGSLIVDPDELRTYHPSYLKFIKVDPDNAAGRVHADASSWAQELRDEAIKRKVNIVLDTSMGGGNRSLLAAVKGASKADYDVEVHVAAVSIEASQQGVRKRFEEGHVAYANDPENNLPPRNVPVKKQLDSYRNIPDAIEALAKSGYVSRVRVADRGGKSLSDISGKFAVKKDGGKSSTKALNDERTRPWTAQEIEQFEDTNIEVEGKLKTRVQATLNPQERTKLQQELDELQKQRRDVVDKKTKVLTSMIPTYAAWLDEYLGVDIDAEASSD